MLQFGQQHTGVCDPRLMLMLTAVLSPMLDMVASGTTHFVSVFSQALWCSMLEAVHLCSLLRKSLLVNVNGILAPLSLSTTR